MSQGTNAINEIIRQEIKAHGGIISFAQFMELALYHPTYGYYQSPQFTLGKHGDFTTASEISPLFAQCFANQCRQILPSLPTPCLLELGAGTGRFAGDLLTELKKAERLPEQYYIYDVSHTLRQKQQALLSAEYPEIVHKVAWLDKLPTRFTGVIIANEVLDAIPINCFRIEANQVKERGVALDNERFVWQLCDPFSALLTEKVEPLIERYGLYDGYESEINLRLQPFVAALAGCLAQGVILFSDYGYGQREYYHPERHRGTLTCFYQHQRHDNPLQYPGLQDITAHVDFTRVIEDAFDAGCYLGGYTTQAAFLLATGLMDKLAEYEEHFSVAEKYNLHQAVKVLTMPMEMGERIKVMALTKQFDLPLLGFPMPDRRRDLED